MKYDASYVTLPLDQIDVWDRLRNVDEDAAQQLALDIDQNGLINAISVRPSDSGRYDLVAGAHRLRAHELLGIDEIRCDVRNLSDDEAELVEISENLFRNDLSAAERVLSLGLWERAFREAHPEIGHGGDRGNQHTGGKVQTSHFGNFDEIMSRQTGRSRRSNFDDLALFKALGEEALRSLSDTDVGGNMVQLKALAKLDMGQRGAAVREISEGRAASVKDWQVSAGHVPEKPKKTEKQEWMDAATKLWAEGRKAWRDQFLREIGVAE